MNYKTSTNSSMGSGFGGFHIYFRTYRVAPPPRPIPTFDPWAVLGLPPGTSAAAIKERYLALAKQIHPDTGPVADRQERTKRMALLNRAYEQLRLL